MHSQHTKISTHACTHSTDAHQQIHSHYTEANIHTCTPSTEACHQIHSQYTEINTQACTPSTEIHHQTHIEDNTKTQIHSLHTDTTQLPHTHMTNFPQ